MNDFDPHERRSLLAQHFQRPSDTGLFAGLKRAQSSGNAGKSAARTFAGILCVLCFACAFVMSVLKIDGTAFFADIPWFYALVLPVGIAVLLMAVYMIATWAMANVSVSEARNVAVGEESMYEKYLDGVSVAGLESHHEALMFWDFLAIFALVCVAGLGALVFLTRCGCSTPYAPAGLAVGVCYLLRALRRMHRAFFQYYRLRNLCAELDHWQVTKDHRRFYRVVLPDLRESPLGWGLLFHGLLWAASITLLGFVGIWVDDGDCAAACPATVATAETLVLSMAVLEGLMLLAAATLQHGRRVSHLEGLERIVARVCQALEDAREDRRLARRMYRKNYSPEDAGESVPPLESDSEGGDAEDAHAKMA